MEAQKEYSPKTLINVDVVAETMRKINALELDFAIRLKSAGTPEEQSAILDERKNFYNSLGINREERQNEEERHK